MSQFTSLEDAAARLGVPKERLNMLRETGELRAYRDGASWKFRTEEIDKLESQGILDSDVPGSPAGESSGSASVEIAEDDELMLAPGSDAGPAAPEDAGDDEDIGLGVEPLGEGDDAESILLTGDQGVEGGIPRPQSTIIGKSELSLEDDLQIASDSDLGSTGKSLHEPNAASAQSASAEEIAGAESASVEGMESLEIDLDEDSDAGKAVHAVSASAESIEGAVSKSADMELDELELDLSGSDLDSDSDVLTGQESRVRDANLSGAGSVSGLSGIDSVQLSADEDDDVVLGGEDSPSGASDSGIDLSPSDSGFALDEVPLELGGSAVGSALDLASLSALSGIGQAKPPSSGAAASGSISEGDFQLTPADSAEDEEDSSQIVALEDVGAEDEPMGGFTPPAPSGPQLDEGFAPEAAAAPSPAYAAAAQETPFPVWVIGMLMAGLFTMTLAGVIAMDLLQSMWAWDEPYAFTSTVMDGLLSLTGQ